MSLLSPSALLRRVLLLDGVASAAMGVLLLLDANGLETVSGLSATLLREAGVGLIPFGVVVVYLSRRSVLPRAGVLAVIVTNAAWVLASGLLLATGAAPNGLGYLLVIGQAAAVLALAELEYVGLRRSAAHAV